MAETPQIVEQLTHDELILQALKNSARGKHALTALDIIDQKVGALFTFTSILVAATLLVASQPGDYLVIEVAGVRLSQALFVVFGMSTAILSAIFAMSCLWLIDLFSICKRASDEAEAVRIVQAVTRSRMIRYRLSWFLTLLTLALVTIAVTLSILESPL